jgi:hypothetical protein
MTEIDVILIGLLVVENLVLLYVIHSWKRERMELTKMIAARNYGEYEAFNMPQRREGKPPPKDRRSMIERQQKRMSERHEKGGTG